MIGNTSTVPHVSKGEQNQHELAGGKKHLASDVFFEIAIVLFLGKGSPWIEHNIQVGRTSIPWTKDV